MKTSEKITFPELQNEYLQNILRQLVQQYNIVEMFFTRQQSSVFSYLIIHIENSIDVAKLQNSNWVKKVKKSCQIDVNFIYTSKLRNRYTSGCPFTAFYCRPSAVIFHNKELKDSAFTTLEWKKYKKNFNVYQNEFYHDHELQKWQIKNLISESSSNSVFTSYARLIEYDLSYLEELYAGKKSASLNLSERITELIQYIPDIQKYFVKSQKNGYYLADLLLQAKEASSEDDVIYRDEMFQAVGTAEQGLFSLIESRLDELKKLIKKGYEKKEMICHTDEMPKEAILDTAVQTILNFAEAEQIFMYHKITCYNKTIYYLLLITSETGNEKLKLITDSLRNKVGQDYNFVLISHSRYWIQNNLFEYQSFFSKIIQDDYLIYSSGEYHPVFHWESPHKPYHGDLHIFYKSVKQIAVQFSATAKNANESYCGLDSLFALFFLSFSRTYIYARTYYMPNYLSSQTLWDLCIYADTDIRKYNYLLENFWTDFFPYADRNRTVFHGLSRLDKDKADQMNVIVEKLMIELHNLVIESGLLKNDDQELMKCS